MARRRYHAVMVDETGCEFGVTEWADSNSDMWEQMQEDYPESRCVQVEEVNARRAAPVDIWDIDEQY